MTAITQNERARAWQAQSLLLGYPDDGLFAHVPLLRRVTSTLPDTLGRPLATFLDHIGASARSELAARYVATFDHHKRGCLYLTYYVYGDTRKRGVALLRLKQAYAATGLRLLDDELPDHLAVLLEFAAAHPDAGYRLLLEHRTGLEFLRLALRDAESPWSAVLDSVAATLPPLTGDQREAALRLAAEGPPEEQVGLEPFALLDSAPRQSVAVGGRR